MLIVRVCVRALVYMCESVRVCVCLTVSCTCAEHVYACVLAATRVSCELI